MQNKYKRIFIIYSSCCSYMYALVIGLAKDAGSVSGVVRKMSLICGDCGGFCDCCDNCSNIGDC
jgi:hypothetical protein